MVSAQDIDALLPQTQCTKCGFNGCLPYAEAIAQGTAEINRCSPGGDATIHALSELLKQPATPLANDVLPSSTETIAVIDEERCIGCVLCIKACPVDAIIGAGKLMHTVISDWCTGCELCVPRCPVDCISLVQKSDHKLPTANINRERYYQHQQRYNTHSQNTSPQNMLDKKSAIKAALGRKEGKNK